MQRIELDYAALTLDSNVFISHGLNLERGLLGQLQQFSSGPVKLVISEVVIQEIRKHLLDTTKTSRSKLQSALKSSKAIFGLTETAASEFEASLWGKKTDTEVVDARIHAFVSTTGALIVPATGMDVNRLLSLYFKATPPFEGSGDKKAEFPDAIALLSLEQWAASEGIQLLAVSQDAGWISFAEKSSHIDAIKDLAEALTHFQPHNAATNIIEALQAQIVTHSESKIFKALNDFIVESTNETEVNIEYSSALHAELDEAEVHHISHHFVLDKNDQPIVDLIRIEANWLSLRLRVTINYEVEAHFSMSVWDSMDRDYVSIGSASAATSDSYSCDVLLSLTGDFSKGIEHAVVGELGIDIRLRDADIGDVEPNMRDD